MLGFLLNHLFFKTKMRLHCNFYFSSCNTQWASFRVYAYGYGQRVLPGLWNEGAEDQRQKYLGPGHTAGTGNVGYQNPGMDDTQASRDVVGGVGHPQRLEKFLLQVGLDIGWSDRGSGQRSYFPTVSQQTVGSQPRLPTSSAGIIPWSHRPLPGVWSCQFLSPGSVCPQVIWKVILVYK